MTFKFIDKCNNNVYILYTLIFPYIKMLSKVLYSRLKTM